MLSNKITNQKQKYLHMFKGFFLNMENKTHLNKATVSAQTSTKNFTELREESIFGYK